MPGLILLFLRLFPSSECPPQSTHHQNHFRTFLFPKPFLTPHLIVYSWKMLDHLYPKGVGLTNRKVYTASSFLLFLFHMDFLKIRTWILLGRLSNIAFVKKLPIYTIKGAGCIGLPLSLRLSVARSLLPSHPMRSLCRDQCSNSIFITQYWARAEYNFLLNINSVSPLLSWLPKIALFIYLCMYFLSTCHHWTLSTLRYVSFLGVYCYTPVPKITLGNTVK